jgi:hypothetical protein
MIVTLWENMIRGLARVWLYFENGGIDLETYYKEHAPPPRLQLSNETQAFAEALYTMATAGKITLGTKRGNWWFWCLGLFCTATPLGGHGSVSPPRARSLLYR